MMPTPERDYVLATARELYGRVVYTHKTHEQEREIWAKKACNLNWINIGLTSITTFFAAISVALKPTWAIIATAVSAAISVAFVVYQSSFDPAGKEGQQRTAAKELLWIREQLLLLIGECLMPSVPLETLQHSLEVLARELTAVYKFAPNTSEEAFTKARKMLQSGRFTFTDDEIDGFLPPALRKNKIA